MNQSSSVVEPNKALIRMYFEEVLNNHNLESVYKYFIPPGGEGFKEIFSKYLSAFPDLHCTIDHIIAEEDKVAVFATWYGTQKGEFQGIPATDKHTTFKGVELYRISNGKIMEHSAVVDTLSMLRGLTTITFNV
jgi:steroid delta-isomerase-like uncharacterized protein